MKTKLILLAAMLSLNSYATTLTGSLVGPNGTGISGTISFAISQQSSLSAGGCGGLKQIMPNSPVVITITSGSLVSPPAIYGNDCLSPLGTYYYVVVKDSNGNQLFNDRWIITGSSIDIGSIVSLPTNTTGTIGVSPLLNVVTLADPQTIAGQKTFSSSLLTSGAVNIGSASLPFGTGFFSGQVVTPTFKVINGTIASPSDFFGLTLPSLHTLNVVDSSGNVVLNYYNGGGLSTAYYQFKGSLLPAGAYNFGSSSAAWSNAYIGQLISPNVAISDISYGIGWTLKLQSANVLGFYNSGNTLKMYLDSSGAGGLGTLLVAPSVLIQPTINNTIGLTVGGRSGQSVAIMDVQGVIGGQSYLKVNYEGSVTVGAGQLSIQQPNAAVGLTISASNNYSANFSDTGGTCRIGFASGGITCPSDRRLKTNIKPLQYELAGLLKLNPVSFNWIKSGESSDGLIAQEVQKVFPKAVHVAEDGYLNVSYQQLVPYLIKAIQDQQKQISRLTKTMYGN